MAVLPICAKRMAARQRIRGLLYTGPMRTGRARLVLVGGGGWAHHLLCAVCVFCCHRPGWGVTLVGLLEAGTVRPMLAPGCWLHLGEMSLGAEASLKYTMPSARGEGWAPGVITGGVADLCVWGVLFCAQIGVVDVVKTPETGYDCSPSGIDIHPSNELARWFWFRSSARWPPIVALFAAGRSRKQYPGGACCRSGSCSNT